MLRIIRFICYIFLFFSGDLLSAQVVIDSTDNDQLIIKDEYQFNDQIDVPSKPVSTGKKIYTGLETGTSFSYSPGNFYGPSFYIAPNISYLINPRFMMQAGIVFERSTYHALYDNSSNNNGVLPMTHAFFYTRGSYLLNSRITIDGTVYKALNDVPKLSRYSSSANYSQNGAIVGINYKLNNTLSFGFHVQMYNNSFQSQNSNYFNPLFGY
jgi:hypothetical protein